MKLQKSLFFWGGLDEAGPRPWKIWAFIESLRLGKDAASHLIVRPWRFQTRQVRGFDKASQKVSGGLWLDGFRWFLIWFQRDFIFIFFFKDVYSTFILFQFLYFLYLTTMFYLIFLLFVSFLLKATIQQVPQGTWKTIVPLFACNISREPLRAACRIRGFCFRVSLLVTRQLWRHAVQFGSLSQSENQSMLHFPGRWREVWWPQRHLKQPKWLHLQPVNEFMREQYTLG